MTDQLKKMLLILGIVLISILTNHFYVLPKIFLLLNLGLLYLMFRIQKVSNNKITIFFLGFAVVILGSLLAFPILTGIIPNPFAGWLTTNH